MTSLHNAVDEQTRNWVTWAANKRYEVSKFEFKFPRARTYELIRARSRLYRSNQASKQGRAVLLEEKKKEKRPRYPRATKVYDLILPVHSK